VSPESIGPDRNVLSEWLLGHPVARSGDPRGTRHACRIDALIVHDAVQVGRLCARLDLRRTSAPIQAPTGACPLSAGPHSTTCDESWTRWTARIKTFGVSVITASKLELCDQPPAPEPLCDAQPVRDAASAASFPCRREIARTSSDPTGAATSGIGRAEPRRAYQRAAARREVEADGSHRPVRLGAPPGVGTDVATRSKW